MANEGKKLKAFLKGKNFEINEVAKRLDMSRQNLSYHFRKDVLERSFIQLISDKLNIAKPTIEQVLAADDNEVNEFNEGYGNVSLDEKVKSHDALLSVMVHELAALLSKQSGLPVQTIIKRLYKASEDAGDDLSE